uniref:Uncharacterized protein n=1 Tax=Arundo donax TaxID=35708 RepID=A0A0A9AKS3_ARUDO
MPQSQRDELVVPTPRRSS